MHQQCSDHALVSKSLLRIDRQSHKYSLHDPRQALTCKTKPPQLLTVMTLVTKIVNFIKLSSLNTRVLREPCEGMTASRQTLLLHTQVRWLYKGSVLKRVLELIPEIKIFLDQHGKQEFLAQINDPRSAAFLVYLLDIFERINPLNLSHQGKEMYIFDLSDKLEAFQMKVQN